MGAPMLQTQEADLKGIDDFLSSFTVGRAQELRVEGFGAVQHV